MNQKLRKTILALTLLLGGVFALIGCRPTSNTNEIWRPKSSLSKAEAYVAAVTLASAIPDSQVYSVAETHSMEPILWGNIFVVAEKVEVEDVKVGDILIWRRSDGLLVIHTCIGTTGTRLTIKGYNNFTGDNQANKFITRTELVGRYVGHVVFDPFKP